MQKGASFSRCGRYRFKLWRIWEPDKPLILWMLHNPSTADADKDDPTLRQCMQFSKSWGFGGLYIGNLSPYRATHPKDLLTLSAEALLPYINQRHIREMKASCDFFILAYGNPVRTIQIPQWKHYFWHFFEENKVRTSAHPLSLSHLSEPSLW